MVVVENIPPSGENASPAPLPITNGSRVHRFDAAGNRQIESRRRESRGPPSPTASRPEAHKAVQPSGPERLRYFSANKQRHARDGCDWSSPAWFGAAEKTPHEPAENQSSLGMFGQQPPLDPGSRQTSSARTFASGTAKRPGSVYRTAFQIKTSTLWISP